MPFTSHPLTEAEARLVISWRYPAPYDVYNLPPWEDSVRHGFGITQSALREREFYAVCRGDAFIGWFRLKPCADGIYLGVGLAPESCGCGLDTPWLEILGRVGIKDIVTCAAGAGEMLKGGEGR